MKERQGDREAPETELEMEESNARSLRRIKEGITTLELCNRTGKDVDELVLADVLARAAGIQRIRSLTVDWSSRVKDLRFIKALPALETLNLFGYHLRSLDGLEWFRHGRYINIETGKNRTRNIEKIAETHIARLSLQWATPGDLDAIARSSTIHELLLSNCPRLSLERWQGVPIKYLGLWNGAIDELADTRHIDTLHRMTIYGCRKLERFAGDNSNVTSLVVQVCNSLDFRTIAAFQRLESLTAVKIKKELPLSAFAQLGQLRSLSLQECAVKLDLMALKTSATKLEELFITTLKRDQVVELSKVNRAVLVSNGRWSYRNGSPVEA